MEFNKSLFFRDWSTLCSQKEGSAVALFQLAINETNFEQLIFCKSDIFLHIRKIFSEFYQSTLNKTFLTEPSEKTQSYLFNKLYEHLTINEFFEKLDYFVFLTLKDIFNGKIFDLFIIFLKKVNRI